MRLPRTFRGDDRRQPALPFALAGPSVIPITTPITPLTPFGDGGFYPALSEERAIRSLTGVSAQPDAFDRPEL